MPKILDKTCRTALGLCLNAWGSLSGITFRRNPRGGGITYWERRYPGALSPAQAAHRVKFQRGYEQWRTLSPQQQADWETAARRFTTRCIGSHLFLKVWWHQDTHFLGQALRHLNLTLVLPGP